jgi:fatty acid desaturase
MAIAVEVIGWIGAVLVLGAYIMVSMGRLSGASPAFQWMNAIGAACFILNTWWHGAIPSMVLNIIWSGIGFAALFRMRRRTA